MKLDSWEPQTLTGNQHKLDSLKIGDSHELFENILFRLKCFFIYLFKSIYKIATHNIGLRFASIKYDT